MTKSDELEKRFSNIFDQWLLLGHWLQLPIRATVLYIYRVMVFWRGSCGYPGWFLRLPREPWLTVWEPLKRQTETLQNDPMQLLKICILC